MRDLEFRAWDIITQRHYAVCGLDFNDDGKLSEVYLSGIQIDESNPNANVRKPSDVIIEQSTGLKDKNGKEIYDGDILEFDNDFDDSARRYVPYFDEKLAAFGFRIYGYQDYISESGSEEFESEMSLIGEIENYEREEIIFYTEHISIIGNIHENPELLEAKNVD